MTTALKVVDPDTVNVSAAAPTAPLVSKTAVRTPQAHAERCGCLITISISRAPIPDPRDGFYTNFA